MGYFHFLLQKKTEIIPNFYNQKIIQMNQSKNNYRTAFIFLTSLFFLWGFITVLVDSLIPRIRDLFTLTYFQAGLVQFAFFGAYFVLSIPSGFLLSKIGYKKGIVLGLTTMAVGCLLFLMTNSQSHHRSHQIQQLKPQTHTNNDNTHTHTKPY